MLKEIRRNIKSLDVLSNKLEAIGEFENIAIYVQEAIEILEIAHDELEELLEEEKEYE